MKTWSYEINISAPIEIVWSLFDFSQQQTEKIVPKLISIEKLKKGEGDDLLGSTYRQVFRQRGVVQEHFIKVIELKDLPEEKRLKTSFRLQSVMKVTNIYELKKISENKTHLKVDIINEALRWDMKFMLFFAGKKPAVDFCKQVKLAAETDARINFNEL